MNVDIFMGERRLKALRGVSRDGLVGALKQYMVLDVEIPSTAIMPIKLGPITVYPVSLLHEPMMPWETASTAVMTVTPNYVEYKFGKRELTVEELRGRFKDGISKAKREAAQERIDVLGVFIDVSEDVLLRMEGVVSKFEFGDNTPVQWRGVKRDLNGKDLGVGRIAISTLDDAKALLRKAQKAMLDIYDAQNAAEDKITTMTLEELRATTPSDLYNRLLRGEG